MSRKYHGMVGATKVFVGESSVNIRLDRQQALDLAIALIRCCEKEQSLDLAVFRKQVQKGKGGSIPAGHVSLTVTATQE